MTNGSSPHPKRKKKAPVKGKAKGAKGRPAKGWVAKASGTGSA